MKTNTLRIIGLPLAALCLLAATPAGAADTSYSSETKVTGDSAGNYDSKTKTESTDTTGTTKTQVSKENVDVEADGDTEVTKTDKTMIDPQGLGNKSAVESKVTTKAKVDGDLDSKSVTKSSTANATDEAVMEKKVRVDSKGNRMSKITHRKSHDPKGLMNKTTTETTDVSQTQASGAVKSTHETTVDGRVTEQTEQSDQTDQAQ
jgi:hypothetical protein